MGFPKTRKKTKREKKVEQELKKFFQPTKLKRKRM
jgi:hypothetical protein